MNLLFFHKKVLRLGSIAFVFAILYSTQPCAAGAVPTQRRTIQGYIRTMPEYMTLQCQELQQDLYRYLTFVGPGYHQNRLAQCGLDKRSGYTYSKLDLNDPRYTPHITLAEIHQGQPVNFPALMHFFSQYAQRADFPTAFSLSRLKVFMPFPGSDRIWLVAVTRSNKTNGFNNLMQNLSSATGFIARLDPTENRYTAHITLGYIKKDQPGGVNFTQQQIDCLQGLLAQFRHHHLNTQRWYRIHEIMYSPTDPTIPHTQLWP